MPLFHTNYRELYQTGVQVLRGGPCCPTATWKSHASCSLREQGEPIATGVLRWRIF